MLAALLLAVIVLRFYWAVPLTMSEIKDAKLMREDDAGESSKHSRFFGDLSDLKGNLIVICRHSFDFACLTATASIQI